MLIDDLLRNFDAILDLRVRSEADDPLHRARHADDRPVKKDKK